MKVFHAKRLLKLANFLTELKRTQFNYGIFHIEDECGSVACALGWAGLIPEFRKAGLTTGKGNIVRCEINGKRFLYEQAGAFFGLSSSECKGLFLPNHQDYIGCSYLGENATPKQVAKMLREFLKHKGFALVKNAAKNKHELVSKR